MLPTSQMYGLAQGEGSRLRKASLLTYCGSFWGRQERGFRYEEDECFWTSWGLGVLQGQIPVSGRISTNLRNVKNTCMHSQS